MTNKLKGDKLHMVKILDHLLYNGPIIFGQIYAKWSSKALQSYTYVLVRSMLSCSKLPVELLKQPNFYMKSCSAKASKRILSFKTVSCLFIRYPDKSKGYHSSIILIKSLSKLSVACVCYF